MSRREPRHRPRPRGTHADEKPQEARKGPDSTSAPPAPQPVLLTRTAERDLAQVPRAQLAAIRAALAALGAGEPGDVKALTGTAPWLRRRAGDWRIVYRRSLPESNEPPTALIVGRIVNRRDLDDAVRSL